MTFIEKLKEIELNLGSMLFNHSLETIQGLFLENATTISKFQMKEILRKETGLEGVSMYDKKYYVADWATWEKIIDRFFIDEMIYKSDYLDCDNFANLFTSIASIMGLNSSGIITGDVIDLDDNKKFRHAFNFIVYKDVSDYKVRAYEPQTDDDVIVTGPTALLSRMNWKLKFQWGLFF